MSCSSVCSQYYKNLSDYSKLDLKFLIGDTDLSAGSERDEIGMSFHREMLPEINFHCSSQLLCVSEDTVMQAMYGSVQRYSETLPDLSIGKALLNAQKRVSFQDLLNGLVAADEAFMPEVVRIVGAMEQAVFLVMFKMQQVDACGAHHKGPSHAAMLESFGQMLIDGGIILSRISSELRNFLVSEWNSQLP